MEDTELANATIEEKILKTVTGDFDRAEKFLDGWHKDCLDRYMHYKSAGISKNIKKDNHFPVPFSSEQVDRVRADMEEKLFFRGEPCAVYGREEADDADAQAKRDFMAYQDDEDDIYRKTGDGILNCLLYGAAPATVNYKEELKDIMTDVEVEVKDEMGNAILDPNTTQPLMTMEQQRVSRPIYQGASVTIIDPIDFYFTPEKRELYDEHPFIIRSKRTMRWMENKKYIKQEVVARIKSEDDKGGGITSNDDLLGDRRRIMGLDGDKTGAKGEYDYIEWQGYIDADGTGEKLWVIGVINKKYIVRLDDAEDVFDLGHPNIVVGTIDQEFGEVRGSSLLDKFHSLQHGMDSLMGIWLKAMRMTVNKMYVVNTALMKTKVLKNESGFVIECNGNPRDVVTPIEQTPISQDVYAGMEMFRQMGQNGSQVNDIASGQVQAGVETLGEANILTAQSSLGMKRYLKNFEESFIEPIWEMRNQINMRYVSDTGYLYSVIGENVVYWRTIEPGAIRANVDFVCEASTRETQRTVITQQVLQAVNLVSGMVPFMGPIPVIALLRKLYREGFGWKEDEINKELLPMDAIQASMMQKAMLDAQASQGAAQGEGKEGVPPQSMPQPKTEGDAIQSAQQQFTPQVGMVG
jgi:hypothetical protein